MGPSHRPARPARAIALLVARWSMLMAAIAAAGAGMYIAWAFVTRPGEITREATARVTETCMRVHRVTNDELDLRSGTSDADIDALTIRIDELTLEGSRIPQQDESVRVRADGSDSTPTYEIRSSECNPAEETTYLG